MYGNTVVVPFPEERRPLIEFDPSTPSASDLRRFP